jgi:hypothetical protein
VPYKQPYTGLAAQPARPLSRDEDFGYPITDLNDNAQRLFAIGFINSPLSLSMALSMNIGPRLLLMDLTAPLEPSKPR